MHEVFWYPKLREKPKGSPTKFFGIVRQKLSDKISWNPTFLSIKFFDTWSFLKLKGSSTKFFGSVRPKNFRQKIVKSPSYAWSILIPETPWKTEGFSYKIFWYCETKKFRQNHDTLSFSLMFKTFRREKFSEAQGSFYEIFRWDKKIQRKIVTPLPLVAKNFPYQKFSENRKGSASIFFGTVRQKIFNGKSWYPLFCKKYRNQWWI